MLTNDVVSFEQPGPDVKNLVLIHLEINDNYSANKYETIEYKLFLTLNDENLTGIKLQQAYRFCILMILDFFNQKKNEGFELQRTTHP